MTLEEMAKDAWTTITQYNEYVADLELDQHWDIFELEAEAFSERFSLEQLNEMVDTVNALTPEARRLAMFARTIKESQ